jgi:uracil-DNA glycosylase family 4
VYSVLPSVFSAPMSDFRELVDATINHVESLRTGGRRFISLRPDTLRTLRTAPDRSSATGVAAAPRAASERGENGTPNVPVVTGLSNYTRTDSVRTDAMAQLRERALQCVKCPHLSSTRKNVVFGVGNIDADLMFVGEAPGGEEDIQGEPFVGAAGQLLTKMIQAMGLSRERVYIANILKCRPDMPTGSTGNRKPTPDEMQTCIPYLHAQIDLIQPKVLVALGGTAMEGLLQKHGIMKLRGNWHTYRNIPLMPTYHPAYLLRNQSVGEKRKVWEDLLGVMEKLGLPISEKQRRFFLRG